MEAAPRDHRFVEARLSGFAWAPLRPRRAGAPIGTDGMDWQFAAVAGELAEDARLAITDADAMHAAGVARLLLRDQKAAQTLAAATRLRPGDARAWSDLAAAQLTIAVRHERLSHLPLALGSVDRALHLDGDLSEARFNRALILENLGLRGAAVEAWREFLVLDPASRWAVEGRERLARIEESPPLSIRDHIATIERAAAGGDRDTIAAIVRADPQGVRRWFEVEELGLWAEAVLAGDDVAARRKLDATRAVAHALREHNGETLLAQSIAVIDAASTKSGLAAAHAAYRQARLLYAAQDLQGAERALQAAAAALDALNSPMHAVARYYAATAVFDQSRVPEAQAMLEEVQRSARTPALRAHIASHLGLCHAHGGRWRAAIDALMEARETFTRLGELPAAGSSEGRLAEVYELLAQREKAWRHRVAAFAASSRDGRPDALLASLEGASRAEAKAGHLDAALALLSVELRHTAATSNALLPIDALKRRATIQARLGNEPAAWSDLREARAMLRKAPRSELQARLAMELDLAEAGVRSVREPRPAIELYSRAIAFFERGGQRVFLPQILLDRARSFRRIGDRAAAAADLDAALAELEQQRIDARDATLRATLFDQQSDLFEEAVDLRLATNDVVGALAHADRAHGRTLLETSPAAGASLLANLRQELRPNQVLVEFMLVPSGLVAFVITRDDLQVVRQDLAREELRAQVSGLRDAITARRAEDEIRDAAAPLFRMLIEPLGPMPGAEELIVIGDRFLEAVPWAALHDPTSGTWLVERLAVTVAPSGAVWAARNESAREPRRGESLLLVRDAGGPDLEPLTATAREALAIASLYPSHRVLARTEASVDAFLGESRDAQLIHFAGHARETAAGDTALLLTAADGTTAELPSGTIAATPLPNTRLVVLAACGTANADSSRLEGMPSLSRAFLAAGVPTVVGSLWPLEDEEAAALSMHFHRELRAGRDAAHALRQAQLALLRGASVRWRHPAAWSGMEVAGVSPRDREETR